MMKFLKNNPIKFILIAVFTLLALTSCNTQKAYGVVSVARSAIVAPRPTVSMPVAVKPTVDKPRANTVMPVLPLVIPKVVETVCKEKGKQQGRCVRK